MFVRDSWIGMIAIYNPGMPKQVPLGVRGTSELKVEREQTLAVYDPKLPPVLSTPHMIGQMEIAAAHALLSYCEGDEVTVGTAISIEHTAACGAGAEVLCEAVLERVEARSYVFRVTARARQNGGDFEIGKGTVTRAFVSVGRFMKRLQEQSAAK